MVSPRKLTCTASHILGIHKHMDDLMLNFSGKNPFHYFLCVQASDISWSNPLRGVPHHLGRALQKSNHKRHIRQICSDELSQNKEGLKAMTVRCSVWPWARQISLTFCLLNHLSIYPSIDPSIHQSIHPSIHASTNPTIFLSMYMWLLR